MAPSRPPHSPKRYFTHDLRFYYGTHLTPSTRPPVHRWSSTTRAPDLGGREEVDLRVAPRVLMDDKGVPTERHQTDLCGSHQRYGRPLSDSYVTVLPVPNTLLLSKCRGTPHWFGVSFRISVLGKMVTRRPPPRNKVRYKLGGLFWIVTPPPVCRGRHPE